jgi:hypothetical protein
MPTYDGIGSSITHRVEVVGDSLFQDVDGGTLSTKVPVQIFSNYYASPGSVDSSRQLRFRVQPDGESNVSNSYVTDMGVKGADGSNYFFITAPQNTSNVGDQNTFVISTTSNVGIGTTDPVTTLQVVGDIKCQTITASNIVGGSPLTITSDQNLQVNSNLTVGTSNLFVNNLTGYVGIGTASPSYALHVQSSTNPQMLIGNSSGGGGNIYFGNGNHGVGRNTGKNNFTDVNDVVLHTAGSGDAGLGTNYANYYLKLTSGGVVLHNGSTVHSSDDRIKINEERITNATETLMKLDPQTYDKTVDINSDNVFGREAGLIIQDIWYDAPELRYLVLPADDANPSEEKPQRSDNIQEDPDYSDWGSKSGHFNYIGLIPYLIKSNQEQQALIDDLDTQLQAEKQKMASLLARIEALENSS